MSASRPSDTNATRYQAGMRLHFGKCERIRTMCKDADKIIDPYDHHATSWDRLRSRELMEKAWLDRFLTLVPTAGSILDIECGSAQPIDCYFIPQPR